MWVGHLLLHHLDAVIERTERRRLNPLDLVVLKLLVMLRGADAGRLDRSLHIGPPLLTQTIRALARDGLVREEPGKWVTTPAGQEAIAAGTFSQKLEERRSFYFRAGARSDDPAHFLRLHRPPVAVWQPGADWKFDPRQLEACVARSLEWKQAHGFPPDVEAVVPQRPAPRLPSAWRRVILDRPEHLPVVLVQGADENLRGFAVGQEGWTLAADAAVLALGAVWREVFPELAEPLPEMTWRLAWQEWCQTRGLGDVAGETTALVPEGHVLRVSAKPALVNRMRATHAEALCGEDWLLVGNGRFRRAVQVQLVESGPTGSGTG